MAVSPRSITYRTGSAAPSRLLRRRRPAALSHAPTRCCRSPYLIYIRSVYVSLCIIPPAPTPPARAEAAGLRLQAIALGLRRTIPYCSGPFKRHVFCNPILCYTSSAPGEALRASRSAPCAPRSALAALRGLGRNPRETEGTVRGYTIPQ